ncbi:MAG TPA: hypothetical protein VFF53_11625 [Geobacteraceae bacterium]|nr:hypothetical protein [Geobacteraceae bacterium]
MIKMLGAVTSTLLISLAAVYAGEPAGNVDCATKGCPGIKTLSPKQLEADALVKKYCTTCHTESRIMDRLKLMRSERDENYEQNVKSIIVKKIRLTGGEISHRDGKKILEYLVTL